MNVRYFFLAHRTLFILEAKDHGMYRYSPGVFRRRHVYGALYL